MTEFEKKTLEMELRSFAAVHFEKPSRCTNLDQIRFYISELCSKIDQYDKEFQYVPADAYSLLAQYNAQQNTILYKQFVSTY
jgi:hypothetical protein